MRDNKKLAFGQAMRFARKVVACPLKCGAHKCAPLVNNKKSGDAMPPLSNVYATAYGS